MSSINLPASPLSAYPVHFAIERKVPSFDQICRSAQDNGGPTILLPTFSLGRR